jgi:hypothetical protein
MPYRRLPNTDMARLRALKAAKELGEQLPPFKLAFSSSSLQKLRQFLPQFENMFHQQRSALNLQVNRGREYNALMRKARLYVSHFYQVLNFAIARNDMPASSRKFYGIRENDSRIPPLQSEKDILFWGDKLLKGEMERISNGGSMMNNPSAAVVKVRYEQFEEAAHSQKVSQKSTLYATDRISSLRAEADKLIQLIWDEVEATFDLLPDDVRREKSSQYGVIYVLRPNERPENISEEMITEKEQIEEEEVEISDQSDLNKIRLDELLFSEKDEAKEQLQYSISF